MTLTALRCFLLALLVAGSAFAADELVERFRDPPDATKPWCYWYWLGGDVTAEGITKDLEAMAKVGIARAMIGTIDAQRSGPVGPVKTMSPQWFELTRHALREANRVGVEIMMFNSPGWSQSGGPWITPERSMRRVAWSEIAAPGGAFSRSVRTAGVPAGQDIAVLAVPRKPAVSLVATPQPGQKVQRFHHSEPFKARALIVRGQINARLYALRDGKREVVAAVQNGRPNKDTDFLPDGLATFSFSEVQAQEFELEPCALPAGAVTLTSEPTVAKAIEKQMARMHPSPSPTWQSYLFPDTVEPDDPATIIKTSEIIDLTPKLDAAGTLTCTLPPGEWTVIHFGMVTTGKQNGPAPKEATGLEVDKLSREHTLFHIERMFGELLKSLAPAERAAFKGFTIDSYEKGAQNWTDGFATTFAKRAGYDPIAMLPVFTGRVVDSAKASDQFLWDLRRIVADLVAENYVGGLREAAHQRGMTVWCENYGHWGFPGEFLLYGGYSDEVGGEFWTVGNLGAIECRAASSSAHIYGKRRVYAESFTSGIDLGHHPYAIKRRGEEMYCHGINHTVLHVYAHQPRDGAPGKNAWFGTAFHRNTPWFLHAREWTRYLQRCSFMLQEGAPVADVAVYIGDFAPQMTGPANPVPAGYDYDYMNSDALLRTVQVLDRDLVVRDEKDPKRILARYRLLAMPKDQYQRPHVRARIEQLRQQGARIIESIPVPSKALQQEGIAPIVARTSCSVHWKARQLDDGMLFFLSNFAKTGTFEATLRASGKTPMLCDPVTGEVRILADHRPDGEGIRIRIAVRDTADAYFIVVRDGPARPSVVAVRSGGVEVSPADLALSFDGSGTLMAESAKPGTYTLTMSAGGERTVTIPNLAPPLPIAGAWTTVSSAMKDSVVVQETSLTVPAGFGDGQRVWLDLGSVSVMAQATLNGTELPTRWMPPFAWDVTSLVKPGANTLRVLIASTTKAKPAIGAAPVLRTVARISVR